MAVPFQRIHPLDWPVPPGRDESIAPELFEVLRDAALPLADAFPRLVVAWSTSFERGSLAERHALAAALPDLSTRVRRTRFRRDGPHLVIQCSGRFDFELRSHAEPLKADAFYPAWGLERVRPRLWESLTAETTLQVLRSLERETSGP